MLHLNKYQVFFFYLLVFFLSVSDKKDSMSVSCSKNKLKSLLVGVVYIGPVVFFWGWYHKYLVFVVFKHIVAISGLVIILKFSSRNVVRARGSEENEYISPNKKYA
jgi:hypothetical protein